MRRIKSNRGSSIITFAVTLTLIAVMAALVLDIGNGYMEKASLSKSVDAAALAGAQELVTNSSNANNLAQEYVAKNETNLKSVEVAIDPDNRGIEVKVAKNINYLFARVIGIDNKDITSVAKARAENISAMKGVRPIAVVQQTFVYGQMYTLKVGGGDGTSGNYAPIGLGGTGSSNYEDNILNGYSGTIHVGDIIMTETGNMAGSTNSAIEQLVSSSSDTYDSYSVDCPRVISIPVVDTLTVNGKKAVKVLGFATFFLEGTSGGSNGQTNVLGRFITYCMDGTTSSSIGDYGTYGIKLVR